MRPKRLSLTGRCQAVGGEQELGRCSANEQRADRQPQAVDTLVRVIPEAEGTSDLCSVRDR